MDLAAIARQHRRELHQIPEGGLQEFKTCQYLQNALAKLPLDSVEVIAGTGIKAVLRVPGAQQCVAFRADIDALSIPEKTGLPFASRHEGMMHACGHDGHMAALLTFVQWCCENKASLRKSAVFLFQPAEESIGGAWRMVEAGALKDPDADMAFGFHLWPMLPKGTVAVNDGALMAGAREFDITLTGTSAHGAAPHLGKDAVVAAAQLITQLQTVPSRMTDPLEPALITVGKLTAGVRRNIIADSAKLECTMRAFREEVLDEMEARIDAMLQGLQAACGVTGKRERLAGYRPVTNHPGAADVLRKAAEGCGHPAAAVTPVLIAEDFSDYQHEIPGAFFFLGTGEPGRDAPLHSNRFDFDEELLQIPLSIYRNIVTGG